MGPPLCISDIALFASLARKQSDTVGNNEHPREQFSQRPRQLNHPKSHQSVSTEVL